jgi:hypothetical protein
MNNKPQPNTPLQIGGRDADLTQIGYALYHETKDAYPINQAPPKIVHKLNELIETLKIAEESIKEFILAVRESGIEDFMSN